jgi:hypothetical protein
MAGPAAARFEAPTVPWAHYFSFFDHAARKWAAIVGTFVAEGADHSIDVGDGLLF